MGEAEDEEGLEARLAAIDAGVDGLRADTDAESALPRREMASWLRRRFAGGRGGKEGEKERGGLNFALACWTRPDDLAWSGMAAARDFHNAD